MNSDIRLAVSFRGHRKRKRLRLLLGPGSTDYLIDLWIATAMNHPNGILQGMDETDIALEAGGRQNRRFSSRPWSTAHFWKGQITEFTYCMTGMTTKDMSFTPNAARLKPEAPQPPDGKTGRICREHAASMPRAMPLLFLLLFHLQFQNHIQFHPFLFLPLQANRNSMREIHKNSSRKNPKLTNWPN